MKVELVIRHPTFTETWYSAIVELSVLPREGDVMQVDGIEFKGDNTGDSYYTSLYKQKTVDLVCINAAKNTYTCMLS